MSDKKAVKSGWKKKFFFLSAFFIFSLTCIIFCSLVLNKIQHPFFKTHFWWLSLLAGGIFIAFFLISAWFIFREKESLVKTSLSVYLLLSFCLIFIYVLQVTGFFAVFNDVEQLQAYLKKVGAWMPIAYIALQFLQVVILPIPGIVSTAAGVAIFGALLTAIYSTIGILSGSFLAFYIGRKWGNKAVSWMIGEETLDKWQKKLKGKDNLFLTLMFLLPLFPDDVLCFVAGLSTMSNGYFAVMIVLTRIISIFATCFSVDFIPLNTWWGITLWVVFFALVIFGFILLYKNMDKIQVWLKAKKKAFGKKFKKKQKKQ